MSNYRNVRVLSTQQLSPHLKRVRLIGDDLNDFPIGEEGSYVKVMLENSKEDIEASGKRPVMRSYTIADFDPYNKILSLDFVVNLHQGLFSHWANNVQVGSTIVLAGPGSRKMNSFPETDYILMGDLSSINAIRAYLSLVPRNARGQALIAVPDEKDIFEFDYDNNLVVRWFNLNSEDYFINQLKNYQITTETIIFGAGEATEISKVKHYLKSIGFPNNNLYISGYWKKGMNDLQYRDEKRMARFAS